MSLEDIQARTLTILAEHLKAGDHVALVDFPNHGNSGDSLIYLGQLKYLSQLGVHVDYVADASRYSADDLRHFVPEGKILIQGGGNFGDRWEPMQAMRERVISDFPDRHIIQLPQGIDFQEGPPLARAQEVLGAHKSLTLLIRDKAGVERTKALFPGALVVFCPDMAFGYGRIDSSKAPDVNVMVIKRRDSESIVMNLHVDKSQIEADWGLWGWRKLASLALRAPGAMVKKFPVMARFGYPLQRHCYDALARLHLSSAVALLSKGRVIVTDRLHATVIAGLMGRPAVAMDNANGKVSAIFREYLSELPRIFYAKEPADMEKAVELFLNGKS